MVATLKTTIIQEPSSATANMTLGTTGGVTFGAAATTNTITSAAATNLTIQSAGTTAMTIDTSQNVGIGTSSPSTKLNIGDSASSGYVSSLTFSANNASSAKTDYVQFKPSVELNTAGGEGSGYALLVKQQGAYKNSIVAAGITNNSTNYLAFSTTNEAMRIDSSGNLLVGTTSNLGSAKVFSTTSGNFGFLAQCGNGNAAIGTTNTSGTAQYSAVSFFNNGGVSSQAGSITVSGSNTAYNTSSDYRLKENVTPITNGLSTIAALNPVNYNWISDKSQGEGFIAHELQAVIPHAVTGEKDAVNKDNSIKPQGVDYSKIVVHLVAAVQEQQAMITALTARITALEVTP